MSQVVRHARRAGRVVLKLYQEYEPYVANAITEMGATCKAGCSKSVTRVPIVRRKSWRLSAARSEASDGCDST